MQTANCVEEKEWVDLLCKICQNNAASMEQYHPFTYRNGVWLWYVYNIMFILFYLEENVY